MDKSTSVRWALVHLYSIVHNFTYSHVPVDNFPSNFHAIFRRGQMRIIIICIRIYLARFMPVAKLTKK